MKTGWHKYFIYISLAFLIVVLYKADYLHVPHIHSPVKALVSLVVLMAGFIANTIAQQRLLGLYAMPITLQRALAMEGLNVFGKYLPGKIWMIMGKAVYLAEKNNYPMGQLSVLFLHVHVVALWCGLMLGIVGLWLNGGLHTFSWVGLAVLALLSAILLSKSINRICLRWVNTLLKKNYSLPTMNFFKILPLLPWWIGVWVLWGGGFFLLASSILQQALPLSFVFCFPLAGTLGILFVFAPGGIGIRESIITGYLALLNVPVADAITIAAASRIWFLMGEVFLFIVGYLAHKK